MEKLRMPQENKINFSVGLYQGKIAYYGKKDDATRYYFDNICLERIVKQYGFESLEAFYKSEFFKKAYLEHMATDGPNTMYVLFDIEITEQELIMN